MTSDKVIIPLVDDQPAKLLSYEVILGELGENLVKASSARDLVKASSARELLEHLLKKDIAVVLIEVNDLAEEFGTEVKAGHTHVIAR